MVKRHEAKPGLNAMLYKQETVAAMKAAIGNHPEVRVVTGKRRRNYAGETGIPTVVVGSPESLRLFWKDVWGTPRE